MPNFFSKILKYITKPHELVVLLNAHGMGWLFSDEFLIKCAFKRRMGYIPDLKKPTTFNEKLQWLKLYDRKPEYATMVDKYAVKKYVSNIIGEDYVIPTLGVWDKFEDIDFDSLPDQFVLKTTHDSGGVVICKDKANFDFDAAKRKINHSLKRNYYLYAREWPYKNVPKRIIAEKFMKDREYETLNVFKIFNFGGVPKIIQVIQNDKTKDETIDYFDTEWNLLDMRQNFPNSEKSLPKPETLPVMLELARKLSANNKTFLRTDFYEINGKVYFSEFTFFSDAGFAKFYPEYWDKTLGDWINLPTN